MTEQGKDLNHSLCYPSGLSLDDEAQFYEQDRRDKRAYHAAHKPQVLHFRKGPNPKTKREQWQAYFRSNGQSTLYVPHDKSRQPTAEQEVWLCEQGETLFQKRDMTFEVVSVHLKTKLFDGEVSLRFQLDENRLVDGKHPWNAYLPLDLATTFSNNYLTVLCSPDKFGQLPTADKQFWICHFRKVAHFNKHGNFIVAIVELLQEDVETKEKHQAELAATEEFRKQQEAERLAEYRKRCEERAERRRTAPNGLHGPGRGVIRRHY